MYIEVADEVMQSLPPVRSKAEVEEAMWRFAALTAPGVVQLVHPPHFHERAMR